MRRFFVAFVVLAALAAWLITAPSTLSVGDLPSHTPDATAGERIFWAGGCASCHATPVDGKRAKGDDKLLLGGGLELGEGDDRPGEVEPPSVQRRPGAHSRPRSDRSATPPGSPSVLRSTSTRSTTPPTAPCSSIT